MLSTLALVLLLNSGAGLKMGFQLIFIRKFKKIGDKEEEKGN
jgi:hypothetical protein